MQANKLSDSMVPLEALIEKARKGDEASFNQLVNLWYKRIYNYVLKQSGNENDAADVTQKTFISVYKNLRKLKEIGSFKPWIYRIATNFCHQEGRRISKAKTVSLTISEDEGESSEKESKAEGIFFNPEMSYRQQELEKILFDCLQELPQDQRSVIIMKEYEGMKFREIADALSTSENTVKTWLYRGLRVLKKSLEDKRITKETLSYEL